MPNFRNTFYVWPYFFSGEEADLDKHCAVKKNISKEQARKDHLDEERRLAHVAATRAKEHLFLNHWAKESETSEYQFTKWVFWGSPTTFS